MFRRAATLLFWIAAIFGAPGFCSMVFRILSNVFGMELPSMAVEIKALLYLLIGVASFGAGIVTLGIDALLEQLTTTHNQREGETPHV
jgi:hypothetical protein